MRVCEKCNASIPWYILINGEKRNLGPRKKCLDCHPYKERGPKGQKEFKFCENCGERFRTNHIKDGKRYKLYSRKNCLMCAPFKEPRKSSIESFNGIKDCKKCLFPKPIKEFIRKSRKTGRDVIGYGMCKDCRNEDLRNRLRIFRQKCVSYKGGSCKSCGYNRCLDALCFHHKDPSKKEFEIGRVQTRAKNLDKIFSKVKPELDKCDLLCLNCHAETHFVLNNTIEQPQLS